LKLQEEYFSTFGLVSGANTSCPSCSKPWTCAQQEIAGLRLQINIVCLNFEFIRQTFIALTAKAE